MSDAFEEMLQRYEDFNTSINYMIKALAESHKKKAKIEGLIAEFQYEQNFLEELQYVTESIIFDEARLDDLQSARQVLEDQIIIRQAEGRVDDD